MALQVWLPLNEDLHNQGLMQNLKIANIQSGCNINTTGKIGKCYTNTGTTNAVATPCSFSATAFSICAWVRFDTRLNQWQRCFGLTGNNGERIGFGTEHTNGTSLGFHFGKNINNTSTTVFDIYLDNISAGVWNHFAMCYDSIKYYIYQNGILMKSGNAQSTNISCDITNLYLFGGLSNYYSKSSLNDLRIYDNCLSAEEVAEIAKGLVLHYPLNNNGFGNENLIANSKQGGSWGYASSGYDRYAPITLVVPDKDVYTLSFEAKSTVNGDKMRTHYYSPNTTTTCISSQGITKTASDGNMDFTLTTTWAKYWVTYHQSATTAVKHVICPRLMEGQGTGTVSVRNVKFEEGSVATSWSPAKTDALYTTMKVNDSIEHDISGYGNDGTITGTLETIGSGPKGTATKFGEYQSPQIYVSDPTSLIPELTSCTLSWWEKCTDSGAKSLPFVGQDGNYYIAAGSATTRLYDQNIGTPTVYRDGIATTGQTMSGKSVYHPNIFHTYNEWHHFVYTNVDFSTWTKFRINSYDTTWPVNAYLSDVRIYATPLTADQVAQLYKDSMVVDSSGNITPRDLE